MDIALLVSELREVPSYSTPVEKLYNREAAVTALVDEASIDALRTLLGACDTVLGGLITNSVNIRVMKTHAKIVKPFVSNADLEDDFI